MDDKLSTSTGRDDYVRNVLHKKGLQSRADFKALMKKRFSGDTIRFSQLMKSYWHVTGESRRQASGRPHKAVYDTAEDANPRGPATLRWLIKKYGVPATTESKAAPKAKSMLIAL